MKKYDFLTKEYLEQKYWKEKLSLSQIAKLAKSSDYTIYRHMEKLNIPCRSIREAKIRKMLRTMQTKIFGVTFLFCKNCGKNITKKSKSGLCKRCAHGSPEFKKKISCQRQQHPKLYKIGQHLNLKAKNNKRKEKIQQYSIEFEARLNQLRREYDEEISHPNLDPGEYKRRTKQIRGDIKSLILENKDIAKRIEAV